MHDGVNRLWILRADRGLDLDGFPGELEAIDQLIRHMLVRSSEPPPGWAIREDSPGSGMMGEWFELEPQCPHTAELAQLRTELVALRAVLRAQLSSRRCAECGRPCDGDPRIHSGPCERDGLTFCSTLCSMKHKADADPGKSELARDPGTLWHAYECLATAGCTAETGTVLDLRMPAREPVPRVKCPRCGKEMRHKKSWEADWAGYGSRSGLDEGGTPHEGRGTRGKGTRLSRSGAQRPEQTVPVMFRTAHDRDEPITSKTERQAMSYDTIYHLTWSSLADAVPRRSCNHNTLGVGFKFCPECGNRAFLTFDEAVRASLAVRKLHASSETGYVGEMSWYEHEEDMAAVSAENPGVVFHLRGRGDDDEDLWDLYALNGEIKKFKAKIVRTANPFARGRS